MPEQRTLIFDVNDPQVGAFCAGLADVPPVPGLDSPTKFVATTESWSPSFSLPEDPTPRAFVRLSPTHVTGRGYAPERGWRVLVCGGDDTAMVFDGDEGAARARFAAVTDWVTRATLTGLGFVNE